MDDEEKIDILLDHAVETNKRLDTIDDNLSEHMRRSKAAEIRQDVLEEEIKPLLEHFNGFKWTLRAVGAIVVFIKLYEFFSH